MHIRDSNVENELGQPLAKIFKYLKKHKSTCLSIDFCEIEDGISSEKNKFIILTGTQAEEYYKEKIINHIPNA